VCLIYKAIAVFQSVSLELMRLHHNYALKHVTFLPITKFMGYLVISGSTMAEHSPYYSTRIGLNLAAAAGTWGLYYKTLRIRNLQENVRFQSKLVTLARTNTLLLEQTNTLAYYGVRRLRIRNFL
jgi:hypothetical protein